VPRRFKQKMLLQTAHQVAKKSGSAHMKFILNGTASQAMGLTIGSERNANSKRSRVGSAPCSCGIGECKRPRQLQGPLRLDFPESPYRRCPGLVPSSVFGFPVPALGAGILVVKAIPVSCNDIDKKFRR